MSSHIQFINSEEQLFYSSVYETVKEFTRISECYKQTKRILVFLPVIPRARFLIHKCAELFPTLSSVSIGKGIFRRVVLYFEQYPSPHLQQIKKQKRDQRYNGLELKLFEMSSPPRARSKRPDQAIYVPKRRINVSAKDTKNESQTEKTDAKDTKKVLQKERTEKSLRPVSEKPTCKITDVKKEAQSNLSKDDIKVEKLAAKLDHLNLKENFVEKHIITTKSTEAIAQKMSEEILHSIFDVLPSKLSRLKAMQNNERQRVVHVQQAHVKLEEMLLPGMATNFVNLAIENALELIKSVKKYESRVPVCTRNEGLLKFANKCSKQILVESIQDNLRCNEEKPSDSVIEKSEGLINSKQDDLDIEESENLKTDGDKCKDEVGDKNNDKDVKCDKKTKVIETPPSQKTRTANTSKKGKATKNKKTKNKNNKDTMDSTEKVSKNEKPVKYGNKVKKVKKNNVEPVSDKEEKDLVETRNQLKTTVDKTKLKDSTAENREEEEDDWDANWTEDGECLNENMLQELSSLTGITNPTVEKAEGIDYLNFTPTKQIELDAGEFGHILELFDFSPNQKTQEIFNILSSAGIKDINLTWVDDTHALAVFASQAAAHNALKQNIPVLQMRQVVNGTRESKAKARDFKVNFGKKMEKESERKNVWCMFRLFAAVQETSSQYWYGSQEFSSWSIGHPHKCVFGTKKKRTGAAEGSKRGKENEKEKENRCVGESRITEFECLNCGKYFKRKFSINYVGLYTVFLLLSISLHSERLLKWRMSLYGKPRQQVEPTYFSKLFLAGLLYSPCFCEVSRYH